MRSPENVLAEMQQMKSQMGITNFEFYDLTAIIQKKWIMDFAQLLIDSKMNISWRIPSGTRTEVLDSEVAEKLRESGCFNLTYAPESGSNRMLKLIKKKVVLSRMLSSMKQSHRAGLNVYMNMILGLPDEKHTDVWKTLWFVARCAYIGVHDIALGIFRPYPGSALFNRLVQEKKIDLEKDDFLVEIIMAIETEKSSYNDHVSTFWYEVYKPLTLSVFYGVKYITSPSKFFQAIVNIARGTHGSRMERSVLYLIRKAKNNILDKIAIRKPVSVKNVS
jgi:radical SAM superfamily enzyme YgiQ (UPF0313 family)